LLALNGIGEGASNVLDVQTAFIPGGSLINPNSSSGDFIIEGAAIFIPGIKLGKAGIKTAGKSLARETTKKAKSLVETLSNKERGPVLSGVLDSKTGEIFFGLNSNEAISSLHPILQKRLNSLVKRTGGLGNRPEYLNEIPGSHSAISALNQALQKRGNVLESQLNQFFLHNRSLRGTSKVTGVPPRCADCAELTRGVNVVN